MFRNSRRFIAGAALAAVIGWANPGLAGTSFTYQGQLKNAGNPADGTFNMTFRIFDAPAGGAQPATAITIPNVDVADGLFSVELDYGATAFNGADRWLEIVVNGTTLSPRVELTNAPYATFSQNTRGLTVESSGDAGIATTSPTAKLQIGTGHNFGEVTTLGVAMRSTDTVGVSIRSDPAGFDPALQLCDAGFGCGYLGVNSAGSFYLVGDGQARVGIGNTSPSQRLVVGSTANSGDTYAQVETIGGNIYRAGLKLRHFSNDYGWTIESDERFASYGLNILQHFADPAGVSTMFMQQFTGNVGLGTTSPGARLHVAGGMKLDGAYTLEFGAGVPGKEGNAGKIGYQTFSSALDIVGAGTTGSNRQVALHAEGGTFMTGPFAVMAGGIGGAARAVGGVFGGRGTFQTFDSLNRLNTYIGPNGSTDDPLVHIADSSGAIVAGFTLTADTHDGVVFAELKAFRVPNPSDPATNIWYASLEGPEAAMYVRGKGRLENGRATIALPEHFQSMMVPESLTVQLTAASLKSHGLAYEVQDGELVVGELNNGQGSYEFSWVATSVRRGFENYQVIRPWDDLMPADANREDAWQARLAEYGR